MPSSKSDGCLASEEILATFSTKSPLHGTQGSNIRYQTGPAESGTYFHTPHFYIIFSSTHKYTKVSSFQGFVKRLCLFRTSVARSQLMSCSFLSPELYCPNNIYSEAYK